MATDSITSQTLALAGVVQTAYLVDQIARTGTAPAESINPSLNSLFAFDANSTEAVYSGIHGVKLGLQVLTDILNGDKRQQYRTIIRYTLGMLYLQKKLSANDELLNIMRSHPNPGNERTLGRVLIASRKETAKKHQGEAKGHKSCAEGGQERESHQESFKGDGDVLGDR